MSSTVNYVPDQDWPDERARLAAMEDLWDPGTKRVIEALAVGRDWRCLEVGAGRGSIARWLAAHVGAVLATDISTRHLDWLAGSSGVKVRRHDILSDPLPEGEFELVHARLVVEHLGGRPALERMVPALAPGGWLVVEAHDWGGFAVYPDDERVPAAFNSAMEFMSRSGFDPYYGRRLVHELERVGLEDVRADGRVRVQRGGSPEVTFLRLSLQTLAAGAIASGELRRDDLEHVLTRLDDPDTVFLSAPMIAAWGRRP